MFKLARTSFFASLRGDCKASDEAIQTPQQVRGDRLDCHGAQSAPRNDYLPPWFAISMRLILIACIFIFLWQTTIKIWQLPDYLLPTPLSVIQSFTQQWHLIFIQALPTFFETLLGLIGGLIFGCCMALLITYCRFIAIWFLPLVVISQIIPTFAIAPLFVIWLGYGLTSKIAMAILMVFFPVTSAFYDGLSKTPASWLQLAKTMQATTWHTFWHIRFPAALPALASGIRIATVSAPMGAIVGEWVGASRGLGYLMLNANARLQIDMMFASLIVLILFALLLYFLIDQLLKRLIWWT